MNVLHLRSIIKKIDWNKVFIVGVIALIVATLNILHVIIGYAKTPKGMVFMGTGHYYLDYFIYLQAIAQGMQGKWLYENYFTADDPSKTIFAMWQYLLLGKIGKIFHLSPMATYWLSVFILTVIVLLLVFVIIRKLLENQSFFTHVGAYILFLFAGPFFSLKKGTQGFIFQPFRFWDDKAVLFDRFGVVPYHISALILVLILLLMSSSVIAEMSHLSLKHLLVKIMLISFSLVFLITFSPAYALLTSFSLLVVCSFFLVKSVVKKHKDEAKRLVLFLVSFLVLFIPAAFLAKKYFSSVPFFIRISEVESGWKTSQPLRLVILTAGPILLFVLFGIKEFLAKITSLKLLLLIFCFASLFMFFSEIPHYLGTHNSRFLTPIHYILFAALTMLGIQSAVKKRVKVIIVILFIFLLYLPGNILAFQDKLKDTQLFTPITYLPKGVLAGFSFLNSYSPGGIVLTSPRQYLGMVLPSFVDMHMYIGRPTMTLHYVEKNYAAEHFLLGRFTSEEAYTFLQNNSIQFVVVTALDGYDLTPLMSYSFLKVIYRNRDIIIFKIVS